MQVRARGAARRQQHDRKEPDAGVTGAASHAAAGGLCVRVPLTGVGLEDCYVGMVGAPPSGEAWVRGDVACGKGSLYLCLDVEKGESGKGREKEEGR